LFHGTTEFQRVFHPVEKKRKNIQQVFSLFLKKKNLAHAIPTFRRGVSAPQKQQQQLDIWEELNNNKKVKVGNILKIQIIH
jgi:hypothetical protein